MLQNVMVAWLLLTTAPQVSEQVVVTAQESPTEAEETLDRQTVEQYALSTTQELITWFPSLFLNVRGVNGVQADISYRGSRGNQLAVTLNGIPLNNIQSYHHNFDIPLAPEDLAFLQVAPAGAGIGSPYGLSGQVEFATADNREERYHVTWGSDRTYHLYAADRGLSYAVDGSGGYRPNTDYHNTNLTWQGMARDVKLLTAVSVKHFGAQDFYAPYPSYEQTQTFLTSASWRGITWYATRHDDTFILDRENPEFYRNDHTTWRSGLFRDFQWKDRWYLSVHGAWNRLESSSLKAPDMPDADRYVHTDGEGTVKGAGLFQLGAWTLRTGLTITYSSRESGSTDWLPFVGLFRQLGPVDLSIEGSRTVRLPDYTELYYRSPVNVGNPDLKAEQAWNLELGARWHGWRATVFYRKESELIDWVRRDDVWHAENIGDSRVWGLSMDGRWRGWRIGYQMISRHMASNDETKYVYYVPKNRWVIGYAGREGAIQYQILDIPHLGNAGVLDVTFNGTGFYLKIRNALDEAYETLPGIPMPGRSYLIGYRWTGPIRF